MKSYLPLLLMLPVFAAAGQMDHAAMNAAPAAGGPNGERLGTVNFPVSCAAASQVSFNRGVALLHNFWYDEVGPQFKRIAESDPGCAMAHWGLAMGMFHEIWDRPSAETMKLGWAEMEKAQALKPKTKREQAYVAALAGFYKPGPEGFQVRVEGYSAAMGRLYAAYPEDVEAGAFYALSLLSAEKPGDSSLGQPRKAMEVLRPLFVKAPDNPGVDHYIVHACDNPAMAAEGLEAADHYGVIAASGPHAFHMPGHIYARLGLWQKDIDSQTGSIRASQAAETMHETGVMDEPHSYDFLMYAYLQSGQDANAKADAGSDQRAAEGDGGDAGHGFGPHGRDGAVLQDQAGGVLSAGDARLEGGGSAGAGGGFDAGGGYAGVLGDGRWRMDICRMARGQGRTWRSSTRRWNG